MSVVLNSENAVSNDTEKFDVIEIREGDWKAYLHYSRKYHNHKHLAERYETVIAYKRACAMAYLGRRAQLRGGVCNASHAHILTQQFIASLEAANKEQRYSRYPWLEALMNILAEIERIQDEISSGGNVFPLVPAVKQVS